MQNLSMLQDSSSSIFLELHAAMSLSTPITFVTLPLTTRLSDSDKGMLASYGCKSITKPCIIL